MDALENYLPAEIIPQGLREQLAPLFDGTVDDQKAALNQLRSFLERLLNHLSISAGVNIREIASRIDKLESIGVIDHQLVPYFHFWWHVSCLGSHFQTEASSAISWQRHLESCRHAAATCLLWYLQKYPPLSLNEQERQVWLGDASTIFTVPFEKIEICKKKIISESLDANNMLLLHGRPWVGKTSVASYFVTKFCNQGYIPLVIHESSLVTFRILPDHNDENTTKNLRLATNAQLIHETIVPRLLHGDSFVVYLDDPFGHRRYHRQNPLMYLRIFDWMLLASETHCLGSLKVIITTPNEFLKEGRRSMQENAKTNSIARDNLSQLNDEYCMLLELATYDSKQLLRVIESAAIFHECEWAERKEYCELLAETLKDERLGFDALHVLCRDIKAASDTQFLDSVSELAASADILDEINNAENDVKIKLCAAYVGEALIEFYRDFSFQTYLSFDDICSAGGISLSVHSSDSTELLSDWLLEDRISTLNLSHFPVFVHPEVRAAVATLAETTMASKIHEILLNLCAMTDTFSGTMLAQWESVHLICRFANFVTEEEAELINDQMFFKAVDRGGDPRNILWALVINWDYIRGSSIERYANGFRKSIPHNFKVLILPFIWEVTDNWTHMSSEFRFQVLALTGKGDSIEELTPLFNDRNTLAFLAAGVTHYGTIQESARSGCNISEKYLDFMNIFISLIAKDAKKNFYTSRKGDGLFEAPGSRFGCTDVLQKLMDLGFRCGTFDDQHPLVLQIESLLRDK